MECERLDYVFINVSAILDIGLPVVLFWLPIFRYFIISSCEVIAGFLRSLMKIPLSGL